MILFTSYSSRSCSNLSIVPIFQNPTWIWQKCWQSTLQIFQKDETMLTIRFRISTVEDACCYLFILWRSLLLHVKPVFLWSWPDFVLLRITVFQVFFLYFGDPSKYYLPQELGRDRTHLQHPGCKCLSLHQRGHVVYTRWFQISASRKSLFEERYQSVHQSICLRLYSSRG